MRDRIRQYLETLGKTEIADLGDIFGKSIPERMHKAEMASALSLYISRNPKKWLSRIPERDIRLLKALCEAGPGAAIEEDYPDYFTAVEYCGLVEVDESDPDVRRVSLSEDVYECILPWIDRAIEEGETTGRFEFERGILGVTNLLGVIPFETFVDIMIDFFEDLFVGGTDRFISLMKSSSVMQLCRYTSEKGEDLVVSPLVGDVELLLGFLPEPRDFRKFTAEEILEAGSAAPWFSFRVDTPEGDAISKALIAVGYYPSEVPVLHHDIWYGAQYPDRRDSLSDIILSMVDPDRETALAESALAALSAYVNILPNWFLGGLSPKEAGNLKVEYSVDPEEDSEDSYKRWKMPVPTKSEGYTDLVEKDKALEALSAFMPNGFPFGMAVPHVAPDDPCPCGSGLKYRYCHGKITN